MRMKNVMAMLLLACLTESTFAATIGYSSTTSWSNWLTASNWSGGVAPTTGDSAYIGGGRSSTLSGVQTGPLSFTYIGYTASTVRSPGYLKVNSGGELPTNYLYLGYLGSSAATLTQNAGTVTVNNELYLKYNADMGSGSSPGVATYNLYGGTLNVGQNTYIGRGGMAVFNQSGGTYNNTGTLHIGYSNYASLGTNSDVAYYNMTGGTININDASKSVVVGGTIDARGHLKMGNETGATGTINGVGSMYVKYGTSANGIGIVQGFGNINLTGALTNNGKVIADGWGGANTSDRTLSMTNFSSIVTEEAKQMTGAGWYAQNRGKLILPNITVAGGSSTAYFGEDAAGSQKLVNSMKLDFADVAGGSLGISLLAFDNSEAAGIEGNIVGLWDIDGSGFDFGAGDVDLQIKYDEALATTLGLAEADLRFYHQVGGSWVDVTTSVDTTNNLITADGVNSFSKFAVGTEIPEPATLSLIGMGALLVLAKRRKR